MVALIKSAWNGAGMYSVGWPHGYNLSDVVNDALLPE